MPDGANSVPVSSLRPGEFARVTGVRGGFGRRARLASMGLGAGAVVRVVHNGLRGPMILQVRGARIALGRGVAAAIHVSPLAGLPESAE